MRVAVYEDNETLRLAICRLVLKWGHEVAQDWADDAAVVIVDRHLTEQTETGWRYVDGLDVIRAVRRYRPACRVVAISGAYGGVDGLEHEAIAAGAHAWLGKPFLPDELRAALEQKRHP